MTPDPSATSLPGTRLLAFASRWFEPGVVASVFEPLVADWQREWREASRARRPSVRLRGAVAFVVAAIHLAPRFALAPLPAPLSRGPLTRVLLICGVLGTQSAVFTYWDWHQAPLPLAAWLLLLPRNITMFLPLFIVAGVDAIRCREPWPDHLQRRAALKLVAIVTLWMVIGGGWIAPTVNQRWHNAVDSANAGHAVAPLSRVDGLTTYELLTIGDHAHPLTALIRPGDRRRELEQRLALVLLPALLAWIRWRLLDAGSTGWFVPLPLSVIGAMATTGVILLRVLYSELTPLASMGQRLGIGALVLAVIGLTSMLGWRDRRSRDQQITR